MAGRVKGYETVTARRGPKNTLMGQKELTVLMWQRTDKNGEIHTEIGVEVAPGDVRKWPADLWSKAQPVGSKLQELLLRQRHPEVAPAPQEVKRPQAQTEGPGREPSPTLPKDFASGAV